MHLHLVQDARKPKLEPRPAKVVLLEARRQARQEQLRLERPRPAA